MIKILNLVRNLEALNWEYFQITYYFVWATKKLSTTLGHWERGGFGGGGVLGGGRFSSLKDSIPCRPKSPQRKFFVINFPKWAQRGFLSKIFQKVLLYYNYNCTFLKKS